MYSSHRSQSKVAPTNLDIKDERVAVQQEVEKMHEFKEVLQDEIDALQKQKENAEKDSGKLSKVSEDLKIAEKKTVDLLQKEKSLTETLYKIQEQSQQLTKLIATQLEHKEALVSEYDKEKKQYETSIEAIKVYLEKLKIESDNNKKLCSQEIELLKNQRDSLAVAIEKGKEDSEKLKKKILKMDEDFAEKQAELNVLTETIESEKKHFDVVKKEHANFASGLQAMKDEVLAFKKEHEQPIIDKERELEAREGEISKDKQILENKRLEILQIKDGLEKFYNRKLPNFHV